MINLLGQDLTIISAALANEIARGKTADEAGLLGAFLTTVGDAVSMISLTKSIKEAKQKSDDKD